MFCIFLEILYYLGTWSWRNADSGGSVLIEVTPSRASKAPGDRLMATEVTLINKTTWAGCGLLKITSSTV